MRSLMKLLFALVALCLGVTSHAQAQSTLYISGTMHIESNLEHWPDPDAMIDFFDRVTSRTDMKWSVGADIDWLNNEPRAAEIIGTTSGWGVEWDIHAHDGLDRAECHKLITDMGGRPTSVISGLLVDEIAGLRSPLVASDGSSFQPRVLWGLVLAGGHPIPAADDRSYGVWRPSNAPYWKTHNHFGNLIAVGGGHRTLGAIERFAAALDAGMVGNGEPVTSATVNVTPDTLTVVDTTDGVADIELWANHMAALSYVEFATIRETANAWVAAGSVASRTEFTPFP